SPGPIPARGNRLASGPGAIPAPEDEVGEEPRPHPVPRRWRLPDGERPSSWRLWRSTPSGADRLQDDPLLPLAVELRVEDALPGPEFEVARGDGDGALVVDEQAL